MLLSEVRTRPVQSALITLGLVVSALAVAGYLRDAVTEYLMDLDVFRDAGIAFLHHTPLYTEGFHSNSGFRFIYPPFAAFLFAPLALVGSTTLQALWTLGLIALVWWMLQVIYKRLDVARASLIASATLGVVLWLEPFRSNFAFGQINIVLMALVVADVLGVIPKRFRGVGIALAAAIKVTPAAFGLLLLLRKDTPSIVRAFGAFLATVTFGYWLRPDSTIYFWKDEFFATDRAGDQDFFRNQALTGLIARMGFSDGTSKILWLVGAAVIVLATAWAAHRFLRAGETVPALALVGLASLLAAPIAVTHHWVYSLFLVPLLVAPRYRSWWPVLVPATLVFLFGPNKLLTDTSSDGWVEHLVLEALGNSQAIVAVAVFVAAVVAARSRRGEIFTPVPRGAAQPQSADATR
ncbi:glycosyltransferase 87 family protein [Rhodococcus chondri]|uniref:Glycosyltransferase 87 family protein n=1 Tax=Rhodococcus chondri TaxID=3065941 RepID=A0ABU7JVM5_9NOCA|nr:glycosyltransferase 87 family protein [Rhodococcus sp. CC-R104]MEE2033342.1 glycosyltransferase 87 family protein [Rhodococcus sp. CC-R104]